MSLINIGKESVKADGNYRYTMPRLQAKVESSGNGIKTILPNLADVAKALRCDMAYPMHFLGLSLGTHATLDKQQRPTIKGKHETAKLQRALDKFIEIFILCPKCALPETRMSVRAREQELVVDCAACGYHNALRTSHKLKNFILKHPPAQAKPTSMDDRQRRQDEEEEALATLSGVSMKDDDDWAGEDSEEAQARRREAEFNEMKMMNLAATVDGIMSGESDKPATPAEALRRFVQYRSGSNGAGNGGEELSPEQVAAELKRLELSRGLDQTQLFTAMLAGLLEVEGEEGEEKKKGEEGGEETKEQAKKEKVKAKKKVAAVVKLVEKYAPVFKLVVKDKHAARPFLSACEAHFGASPSQVKYLPHVLLALYHADALEEEAVLAWHGSPADTSAAVRARKETQAFVEWLKTAEAEEEEAE